MNTFRTPKTHTPLVLHLAYRLYMGTHRDLVLGDAANAGIPIEHIYKAMHVLDIARREDSNLEWLLVKHYAMAGWLEGWVLIDAEVPPLAELERRYRESHHIPFP